MKPKVLIFSGYGINSEEETKFAFDTAGGEGNIVHINDLIAKKAMLHDYQILAFPGGFAYGDDTGSGNAYANKVKNHLWPQMEKFLKQDKLIIGICNGFQILACLGLLPAVEGKFGQREMALMNNESARYSDRWVDLKVENDSVWLKNFSGFPVAIAHGEGRFFLSAANLAKLKKNNQVALRYEIGEITTYQNLPANPNGAIDNVAGVTDKSGRILGLMPHPERAMFFTQLPNWPLLKEQLKRVKKPIPTEGPGLQIFKNGVNYFK